MRCLVCNTINHANARFCTDCGASLAPAAWGQSAPTEGGYVPAPTPGFAPAHPAYAPPPPAPHMVSSLSAAPGMYPAEASGVNASAYAPYGYMPAPAPGPVPYGYAPAAPPAPNAGPSLINNVTVQQVTPQAPAPAPTPHVKGRGKRRASDVTVLLSALYFLASGIAVGMMWTTVHAYDGGTEIAAALAITAVALLIDIMILARITRR